MTTKRGLLVIGTQRSGSNLLRLMLNQLPDVVALHPPHILQTFMPLLPHYQPLNQGTNFDMLVDDVCSFVEKNPASWEKIPLNRAKIKDRAGKPSLIQVFRAIHETAAEFHKKDIWCCKSMANVSYIPEIEEDGLRPMYLHLYRDGRDVALSFKKAMVGDKHIYNLAKQWKQDQDESLNYTERYAKDRVISVRYEELIADAEKVMKNVCARLGATYTSEVLQYNESEEAKAIAGAGEMWKNVTKPIMADNHNKFLGEMTEEELKIFETVAGETLIRLGYKPIYPEVVGKQSLSTSEIKQFNDENARLKKEFRSKVSANDLEKRRGQEEVMARINQRFAATSATSKSANL